jgi:predicted CopG family antitoxin
MNFKEDVIRKTTQSVDIDVRKFVISQKKENESFNDTLRRLLNIKRE